jgi:hypothetical protein
MLVSKPKRQTLVALGIFLVLVFCSFFMLFHSLLTSESYFIWKIVLAPIILVIGMIVLGKFIESFKTVTFDKNKLDVLYHFSRKKMRIQVKEILGWREEVVQTKSGDFREVKILMADKKILKLSNRENSNYERVITWLRNKIKTK